MTVLTINLKDDAKVIDAYRRFHREVWPEVQQSLKQCGVRRMDIFLLGRRLVMVVEMKDGTEYSEAFKSHAVSSPRVIEWERLMKSLQEPASGAGEGEWWAPMEPVFHLDEGGEPAIARVADRSRTS